MKIASRNVNGIRSVLSKGFLDRVQQTQPEIICLQEVKAFAHQVLPQLQTQLEDYEVIWHQGTRPGYSGTAIFYRPQLKRQERERDSESQRQGNEHLQQLEQALSQDGRFTRLNLQLQDKKIALLNFYFPNG